MSHYIVTLLPNNSPAPCVIKPAANVKTHTTYTYTTYTYTHLNAVCGDARTGVATLGKFTTIDRAGFEDRAYRLHYSNSQNRTDAFSSVGAVLGCAATALLFHQQGLFLQPLNLVGSAAAGSSMGILLHILTKPEDQKTPNQMVNIIKYEATGK